MAVVSPSMVVDAPVKIPDMAPLLAPTKPGSDRDNEKAKKFKLLLFNDNVNRWVMGRAFPADSALGSDFVYLQARIRRSCACGQHP